METSRHGTWEEAVRWLLEQPGQQQVVLDCYYDQPTRVASERYARSAEWIAVRALLGALPPTAVDIGAAHGITSAALASAGVSVVAVEPDPSDLVGRGAIVRLASELGVPIEARDGTVEAIPAPDGAFDLGLARQVLHHARDLGAACREIFRVLRPGAPFLSIRDHVISAPADLPVFQAAHPLHRLYGGENAFREREYLDSLRSAGFVIERVIRPFDSVINFAPHTPDTLRAAIVDLARRVPLGAAATAALLRHDALFDAVRSLMSRVDRRPGRLISILCRKPGEASRG